MSIHAHTRTLDAVTRIAESGIPAGEVLGAAHATAGLDTAALLHGWNGGAAGEVAPAMPASASPDYHQAARLVRSLRPERMVAGADDVAAGIGDLLGGVGRMWTAVRRELGVDDGVALASAAFPQQVGAVQEALFGLAQSVAGVAEAALSQRLQTGSARYGEVERRMADAGASLQMCARAIDGLMEHSALVIEGLAAVIAGVAAVSQSPLLSTVGSVVAGELGGIAQLARELGRQLCGLVARVLELRNATIGELFGVFAGTLGVAAMGPAALSVGAGALAVGSAAGSAGSAMGPGLAAVPASEPGVLFGTQPEAVPGPQLGQVPEPEPQPEPEPAPGVVAPAPPEPAPPIPPAAPTPPAQPPVPPAPEPVGPAAEPVSPAPPPVEEEAGWAPDVWLGMELQVPSPVAS